MTDRIYCNVRPYPFEVVKKLSMVVTPSIVRAGTAFHSNQKVRNEDDTKIIPEKNTNYWNYYSKSIYN